MHPLAITLCRRTIPANRGEPNYVACLLEEAGHRVTQVTDEWLDLRAADLLWLAGNANWYPKICRQLMATPKAERPPVLIWHNEPLPPPQAAGLPRPRLHLREIAKILLRDARATDVYSNIFRLRQLARHGLPDLLIVSTRGRQEFLHEQGIRSVTVPLGYSADRGHDMGRARDIDVLFLGTLDVPRRRRFIRRLRRTGIDVLAMGSWFDASTWGDNRTELLNRTKILLNFGRYPGELSGLRLILGMANKALVISEPIYHPSPYVPGEHYVSATVEEMPQVIRYYLAHEEERQRIVDAGHRLVTEEVTLRHSVSRIQDLIRAHLGSRSTPPATDTRETGQAWRAASRGIAGR
jgi:hypothetical protein